MSRQLEKASPESANSIIALQEETKSLSQMVIRSQLALDHLLELQDRVCALLTFYVLHIAAGGVYVNQYQKNKTDRNKIKTHLKILPEVRQGFPLNLFGWLTS